MGTRALIHVKEGRDVLTTIYRQYDGYPEGLGLDIKKILNNGKVTILNGFGRSQKTPEFFNGMGCLGAFLVGKLKTNDLGNVYLMPPNSNDFGEEFIYTLSLQDNKINLTVLDVFEDKVIFDDAFEKFNPK